LRFSYEITFKEIGRKDNPNYTAHSHQIQRLIQNSFIFSGGLNANNARILQPDNCHSKSQSCAIFSGSYNTCIFGGHPKDKK
jgi:hypothetical protein